MISIRRVSLGGGFRYLMESVAAGDGDPEPSKGLAAYYAASRTPPGVFLGAGLADLDSGRGVSPGTVVSEEHLYRMLVELCDPVSGEPLGSAPRLMPNGAPVAGFDLTFSVPKSVSVAFALADDETRKVIVDCHRRAVAFVLSYAEANVFRSRSGTNGVVEEDVTGVIATAFTHWSSRADDPQLHDHVVVWNRATTVSDGRWRTLDSRAVFKSVTTLSELHQGVLSDYLTDTLGAGWEPRRRRHSERPRFELAGVSEELMAEFSQRAEQVATTTAELEERFLADHGRRPGVVESMRLRQWATVASRPGKSHHSLAELTEAWRERAGGFLRGAGEDGPAVTVPNELPLLRACDLEEGMLAEAAAQAVAAVADRRATYGRRHLLAEAHRLLHGVRFASADDRVVVAERIAELAIERSLRLTPPPLWHTPLRYLRPDGSSRLRPEHHVLYTTRALMEAEARLLEAGREGAGPAVGAATVAAVVAENLPGRDHRLGVDQALAVEQVATSDRVLDVLVGPGGTGKSSAMAALRAAWEAEHGAGSVLGLAPSAAAAEVLAGELQIPTENLAKWLTEHRRVPELAAHRREVAVALGRHPYPASAHAGELRARLSGLDEAIATRRLHAGQLVVLDEASVAGTLALDELVTAARTAGAKVLLIGDWAQLPAVEAGGAFALLVRDRGERVPELTEVRRFVADWERRASVELRLGDPRALDGYESHGRVAGGEREAMLDALYAAWKVDVDAGRESLMIAGDAATVAELNVRARTARVVAGAVALDGVPLAGGMAAGAGDEVVTRRNDRSLRAGGGWLKNGDRWVVTGTSTDGSLTLRRAGGKAQLVLPAAYVAEHVELAYATTAHRAQGRAVATAHVLVSPATSRELLYVAATRGREANRLYVDTSFDPDPATGHDTTTRPTTAREVLTQVLANGGSEASAHETVRREQARAEDFATLVAEYETLAQALVAPRLETMLERAGLSAEMVDLVRRSDAYGPFVAIVRDAEAHGLDVGAVLPSLVSAHRLDDADDVAAVLRARLSRWQRGAAARQGSRGSGLIAGLVPRSEGPEHDPDVARALREREEAIRVRSRELAVTAIARRESWLVSFGVPPGDPVGRQRWLRSVAVVAAYRELSGDHDPERPVGTARVGDAYDAHRRRAFDAARRAMALAGEAHPAYAPSVEAPRIASPREPAARLEI